MEENENLDKKDYLLRRSLHLIKTLQKELKNQQQGDIAIIATACRFPGGVKNAEEFWKFLKEGKDGIIDIPLERWDSSQYYNENPDYPGTSYVNRGGFLSEDITLFEPKVFGISPREAQEMDPQQRLLLEMCWEAAENAGFPLGKTEGSKTGVFIGMTGSEYSMMQRSGQDIGPYTATGSAVNIASGRIAHTFGFEGPAITLDTACSSSLVAVHLACQSIRNGDCDCAFAGGVNVMLNPGNFVVLSKLNALSEDGACKVFDEDANGYVRAEGGGIVVLKKLSKAIKDKDPILAVIKGSAINQDGFTSGLTVPNGTAQKHLLEAALKNAGVDSKQIAYIEAHGTGTKLGDPIEVQAISEVFSKDRTTENPLFVGAVKSNVGHLEAAAGMAGLIKVIMMLQYKQIPPNIHFHKPNPRIPFEEFKITVPTSLIDWNSDGARLAGISGFGFSGTNAHIILQEAGNSQISVQEGKCSSKDSLQILALSGVDDNDLLASVDNMKIFISHSEDNLDDICYTQNCFRRHFDKRATFVGRDKAEICKQMENWSTVENSASLLEQKIVFVFPHIKENCLELVKELSESIPAFRSIYEDLKSSIQVPAGKENDFYAFVLQYGIAKLLELLGISCNAVAGDGNGESAALYYAQVIEKMMLTERIAHSDKPIVVKPLDQRKRMLSLNPVMDGKITKTFEWIETERGHNDLQKHCEKQGYSCQIIIGATGESNNMQFYLQYKSNIRNGLIKLVGKFYEGGTDIDWMVLSDQAKSTRCMIPNYPFQKRSYWKTFSEEIKMPKEILSEGLTVHAVESPLLQKQFTINLSMDNLAELRDNDNILHVGYYQELLCRSISLLYGTTHYVIETMKFYQALYIKEQEVKTVYIIFNPLEEGWWNFKIYTKSNVGNEWLVHADGVIKSVEAAKQKGICQDECNRYKEMASGELDGDEFYEQLACRGFLMGESVKWVEHIWYNEDVLLARFRTEKESDIVRHQLKIHPGIIDACAQLFLVAGREVLADNELFMVNSIGSYQHNNQRECNVAYAIMRLKEVDDLHQEISCTYEVFDEKENLILRADEVRVKRISQDRREKLRKEVQNNAVDGQQEGDTKFIQKLRSLDEESCFKCLEEYLASVVSELLVIPIDELDMEIPLLDIGMDSLVGLELKKKLEKDIGISVPMEQIIQGPSVNEFTEIIHHLIKDNGGDILAPISFQNQYSLEPERWIMPSKNEKDAKVRLFCIPYGVKGASLFADWEKYIPDTIEVCPIQFPGKENRISEMPISDIDEMVDALEQVLENQLDKPFAFYGHSVGALVAYRISMRLQQKNNGNLKCLFVGAYSAPNIVPNPVYEKVMKAFGDFGFDTLPEIEQLVNVDPERGKEYESYIANEFHIDINDEVRDLVKPVGFSDFRLVHTYHFEPTEEKLRIPLIAFHGSKDEFVQENEIIKWGELTDALFEYYTFEGDHFFIHKDQAMADVLDIISEKMIQVIEE